MNPESNEALSRRVAEAAGWHIGDSTIDGLKVLIDPRGEHKSNALSGKFEHLNWRNIPKFAESLDAISALERESGLRVDVVWTGHSGDCTALAFRDGTSDLVARRSADTEPRARCLAYLAYLAWANKKGR